MPQWRVKGECVTSLAKATAAVAADLTEIEIEIHRKIFYVHFHLDDPLNFTNNSTKKNHLVSKFLMRFEAVN